MLSCLMLSFMVSYGFIRTKFEPVLNLDPIRECECPILQYPILRDHRRICMERDTDSYSRCAKPYKRRKIRMLEAKSFKILTHLSMERPAHLIEKFVVSADGTRVFAGALGNPEKPALVFIHGMTLSGSVYNNLFSMPELSNDFYLVGITLSLHLGGTK